MISERGLKRMRRRFQDSFNDSPLLLSDYYTAHAHLIASLFGLSDEQLDAKPMDGGWTLCETIEHVLFARVFRRVRGAAPREALDHIPRQVDPQDVPALRVAVALHQTSPDESVCAAAAYALAA